MSATVTTLAVEHGLLAAPSPAPTPSELEYGVVEHGIVEYGVAVGGVSENGVVEDGPAEDSIVGGSVVEDRAVADSVVGGSVVEDRTVEDGVAEHGVAEHGVVEGGSAAEDSVGESSAAETSTAETSIAEHGIVEDDVVASSSSAPPPPPQLDAAELEELNRAMKNITIRPMGFKVNEDTCLAHLKLLGAFHTLKEQVGCTDGLFDIWNTRARRSETYGTAILAMLQEKRWALFVARAVDRYEAWWTAMSSRPLTIEDMQTDSEYYTQFTSHADEMEWNRRLLPPLDVLMIWHAHMLNPRIFLEDCLRYGLGGMWRAGMPWALVNEAIDTELIYEVDEETKHRWAEQTGHEWDNIEDGLNKTIECPVCHEVQEVPWTTCGLPEHPRSFTNVDILGEGYGDAKFSCICHNCDNVINPMYLELARFSQDAGAVMQPQRKQPMPGTILNFQTGLPERRPVPDRTEQGFPTRLVNKHAGEAAFGLLKPGMKPTPTMEIVRRIIEMALASPEILSKVNHTHGEALRWARTGPLSETAKTQTRIMMSRYWGNMSPFGIDLIGAVQRQSSFTEKMYKMDWIHSPAAYETMSRLSRKYDRFITIMAENPRNICVPTLDVDLAWHTHQLSPKVYFDFTVFKTGKFVDHDDKINEDKLNSAFMWISKTYEERYNEVYSECTCWYCEAIRASHCQQTLGGVIFGGGHSERHERIANNFYSSGQAQACPPENSAHISAHNSVMVQPYDPKIADLQRGNIRRRAAMSKLEEYHRRARRAHKKRPGPKDKNARVPAPTNPPYLAGDGWSTELYPGINPFVIVGGSGGPGACAAGTCGGGVGGGACGGTAAGSCGGAGGCGTGE